MDVVGPGVVVPRIVHAVPAGYPTNAPDDGVWGASILSLTIGADGKPVDIHVVRSRGERFDIAAIEAVKQSTYEPGMVDDKPVPVRVTMRVPFFSDYRPAIPMILPRINRAPGSAAGAVHPPVAVATATTPSDRVKVYVVGPGVTAPELLPFNLPPLPSGKCKKRNVVDGRVKFSLLVDTAGKPRNIMFLDALGTDLDKFALDSVASDRFNPGTHQAAPVVVSQSVEVDLHACAEETKDESGKKAYSLRLISQPQQRFDASPEPPEEAVLTSSEPSIEGASAGTSPVQRVGGGVSAPVVLRHAEAEFSDKARRAKYQGVCVLSLVVDSYGMPQNVKVVRPLGMGLDEKAVESVLRYRFKPAMKDGAPVPVMLNIEVSFRLY
jgi:TonB family protein